MNYDLYKALALLVDKYGSATLLKALAEGCASCADFGSGLPDDISHHLFASAGRLIARASRTIQRAEEQTLGEGAIPIALDAGLEVLSDLAAEGEVG